MFPRPIAYNLEMQQTFWHRLVYHKEERKRQTSGQIIGAYQSSLPQESNALYFLLPCRDSLLVAGDESSDRCVRDVRAEWLGIENPQFRGRMSIKPEQKQIAAILDFHQDISFLFETSYLDGFWVDLFIPITSVENALNLQQFDLNHDDGPFPQDIIQALGQPCWQYSKFYTGSQTKIGLGSVVLRLGRTYLSCGCFEAVYYSGLALPTGSKQDNEYLFQPFLGNNNHLGFKAGTHMQIALSPDSSCTCIALFVNFESTFFIRNYQRRSFDLIGKPWSRYLQYNHIDGPPNQNVPGVNILTQCVRVKPFNMFDFFTGFRVINDWFEFETGYGLWAHGDEQVTLTDCFPCGWGIAGEGPLDPHCPCPTASTASCSTIARQAHNDKDLCGNNIFIPVTEFDLDFKSAKSRSALNHKVHVAFGLFNHGVHFDSFMGAGAYYEMNQRNSALKTWGIFFKAGSSF